MNTRSLIFWKQFHQSVLDWHFWPKGGRRNQMILAISLSFISVLVYAQDSTVYWNHVDKLCSNEFHGRGYVNQGDGVAADYLKANFQKLGLESMGDSFFQSFTMPVNTFPNDISLSVDGKSFVAGVDFIPVSYSASGSCICDLMRMEDAIFVDKKSQKQFLKIDVSQKVLVFTSEQLAELAQSSADIRGQVAKAKATIELTKHEPMATPSTTQKEMVRFQFKEERFPENATKINYAIKSEFISKYETQNVVGMIEGKVRSDSFIVVTAHYDHIGEIGSKAIFRGANDNASGTSMLLMLAEYFSKAENQPDYSIVFIGFAAEEAGLIGSKYFVDHPLVPLQRIHFLLNIDLVGAGSEGAQVVNSTIHTQAFEVLKAINDEKGYLPKLKKRGKAANSDHYFFSEAGVPAFFIYSLGEVGGYHSVLDTPEELERGNVNKLFSLFRDFLKEI